MLEVLHKDKGLDKERNAESSKSSSRSTVQEAKSSSRSTDARSKELVKEHRCKSNSLILKIKNVGWSRKI